MKKLVILCFILWLFPILSGQANASAIGLVTRDVPIFLVYLFTLISFIYFILFLVKRNRNHRIFSLLVLIPAILIALYCFANGNKDINDMDYYLSNARDYGKLLGAAYTNFIVSAIILGIAPFLKSYSQLEAILGQLMDVKDFLVWVRLKWITTGEIEITFYQAKLILKVKSPNIYAETTGEWKGSKRKYFKSIQEAVDYLRATYSSNELKFVERGKLQNEFIKYLT